MQGFLGEYSALYLQNYANETVGSNKSPKKGFKNVCFSIDVQNLASPLCISDLDQVQDVVAQAGNNFDRQNNILLTRIQQSTAVSVRHKIRLSFERRNKV